MNASYKKALLGSETPFSVTEAFKEVRTNLLYTARDERCPVYGITSAFAHSGKSVCCANLAVSFAQLGKRVLLIDCDLRNPIQHRIFEKDRSFGVSELLAGIEKDFENAIKSVEKYPGLDVLLSGHIPPNPSELLASEHFSQLLERLKECYDCIFIDFPPGGLVVDALIPSRLLTGYVVVVRAGLDDKRALGQLISSMKRVDAKLLGLLLNDVNPKENGYYTRPRRHYRYDYQYTGEKK